MGLIVALAASLGVGARFALPHAWSSRRSLEGVVRIPVRPVDLSVSLTTSGRIESANKTIIQCELENLEVRVRGQGMSSGGSSTILEVVPEGSTVKRGEVLCRLDASRYEELVRQQQMNVERAKADHRQAELNLEVAQMGVREYRDGNLLQDLKQMKGTLSLAESELARQTGRMAWAKRMQLKGYLSMGQVAAEKSSLQVASINVERNRRAYEIYEHFTVPRTLRTLENQVKGAEAVLRYQDARLKRNVDRLEHLERQVERCTIRAPHDGFVIYANDERRGIYIDTGVSVHQKQRLFYLPDLARMEVEALLHESIVGQVRDGMLARVRVEGLPNRSLEGHVIKVAQLATPNLFNDVRYFIGIVKIDTVPRGLRPGMTAEVEIMTERRPGVLAIPSEALAIEDGREVCYVARNDGLERREVKVGQSTRELLEVTEGLAEGDEVVLDPRNVEETSLAAIAPGAGQRPWGPAESAPAVATH